MDGIISAMHWLGMDPDEGPFRQSLRTDRYRQAVDALEAGYASMRRHCTRTEIEARNKANGTDFGLLRLAATAPARGGGGPAGFRPPTRERRLCGCDPGRGRVPLCGHGRLRGREGQRRPLFVLANVVDDIDMSITHVIRGEDLLPTTPKGVLVWEALLSMGWTTDGSTGTGPVLAPPPPAAPPAHAGQRAAEETVQAPDPAAVESYLHEGHAARRLRRTT